MFMTTLEVFNILSIVVHFMFKIISSGGLTRILNLIENNNFFDNNINRYSISEPTRFLTKNREKLSDQI